jgi:hypothetical protein
MIRDRRLGLAALGLGILLIALAQRVAPLAGPPLYDGIAQVDPYAWLVPPAGARAGAKGALGSAAVDNGANRLIAIATPENPPQAQVFATSDALTLPAGTTSIKLSIEPILPQTLPADGHIDGNVYRISITNQTGLPLTAPASADVTVVMRSPHLDANQTIEVNAGQGWQQLKTQDEGFAASYLTVVTNFGDFAMVAPGVGAPYPTATPLGGALASAGAGGSSEPSAEPSASVDVPSIGVVGGSAGVGGSPSPSAGSVAADASSGGGPPPALIGAVVVLALFGAGFLIWSRGRRRPPARRPPPYRGASRH